MTAVIKQEKLPQLYNSVLDEGQLFKLFQDIHACTDVLSVLSKPKPGQCVTRIHMDLNQAYQMLLSNEVRGYRFVIYMTGWSGGIQYWLMDYIIKL